MRSASTLVVDGPHGRLEAAVRGAGGVPVLLVHGNGGSRRLWQGQLGPLGRHRLAVAVDLHGFGGSQPCTVGEYSPGSFTDDLAAVADRLGIGRCVLVGHSLGAAVVALFAALRPDRVAGLVLVDSVADMRDRASSAILGELEPDHFADTTRAWFDRLLEGATPKTRRTVLSLLAATPREAFVGAFQGLLDLDLAGAVSAFDGPALHLYVPRSQLGPRCLNRLLPGLPSQPLHGVSHWPMLDRPDRFGALLGRFLVEIDASETTRGTGRE